MGSHGTDRTFSIRTGDMDETTMTMGILKHIQKIPEPVEIEMLVIILPARVNFIIDKTVKKGQRLFIFITTFHSYSPMNLKVMLLLNTM